MPCYCVPSLVSQLAYYIKGKPVGYRLIRTYDFYFITIRKSCKAITAAFPFNLKVVNRNFGEMTKSMYEIE